MFFASKIEYTGSQLLHSSTCQNRNFVLSGRCSRSAHMAFLCVIVMLLLGSSMQFIQCRIVNTLCYAWQNNVQTAINPFRWVWRWIKYLVAQCPKYFKERTRVFSLQFEGWLNVQVHTEIAQATNKLVSDICFSEMTVDCSIVSGYIGSGFWHHKIATTWFLIPGGGVVLMMWWWVLMLMGRGEMTRSIQLLLILHIC